MRAHVLFAMILVSSLALADREAPKLKPDPSAKAGAPMPADMPMPGDPGAGFATGVAPGRPRPIPKPVFVPPAEVAKVGKTIAGTYKCKGVSLHSDGSS
jgi:hypothetical protein